MSKRVAIVQSNYIPWKGYFDLINLVEEFILFDDMQYTRRDWRNRNKIKTRSGSNWLTIPVEVKGKYYQKIKDAVVSDRRWNYKHWDVISHNYKKAQFFKCYSDFFEELYMSAKGRFLSQINYHFITAICGLLGIETKISWSMDYRIPEGKTERLVALCKQAGATAYISGPAAKAYIDEKQFLHEGISIHYVDYSGYPEYQQLFPPFDHHVSVIDVLFNTGPKTRRYLKTFGV